MSEPSTDETAAMIERVSARFGRQRFATDAEMARHHALMDAALAARPAVDEKAITRVLREHRRVGPWECGCEKFYLYHGDPEVRARQHEDHQAQAVIAYLEAESRG